MDLLDCLNFFWHDGFVSLLCSFLISFYMITLICFFGLNQKNQKVISKDVHANVVSKSMFFHHISFFQCKTCKHKNVFLIVIIFKNCICHYPEFYIGSMVSPNAMQP
jgi:hypothetical protein